MFYACCVVSHSVQFWALLFSQCTLDLLGSLHCRICLAVTMDELLGECRVVVGPLDEDPGCGSSVEVRTSQSQDAQYVFASDLTMMVQP